MIISIVFQGVKFIDVFRIAEVGRDFWGHIIQLMVLH